jgi:putative oxidoreductase
LPAERPFAGALIAPRGSIWLTRPPAFGATSAFDHDRPKVRSRTQKRSSPRGRSDDEIWPQSDSGTAGPTEEEVMKADALMRFILSGNRSLEKFAVLFARVSLGVFFAIPGGNKLFVASQYKLMDETIVAAGIPFPHVMAYFVSSVEFVCGCLLVIGLLSSLCCVAFIIDMIVAIITVQLAAITKALAFIDWLDDFLYLPEVMYIIILIWLISRGSGRFSADHWIVVRLGLFDDASVDQQGT